jgi:hypothetical protein
MTMNEKFFEALKEALAEQESREPIQELPTLEDFLSVAKDMPFQDVLDNLEAPMINSIKVLDKDGKGFEFVGKFTYIFTEDFENGTNLIVKAVKE